MAGDRGAQALVAGALTVGRGDSQTYQIFRDECRRQLQLASCRRRFTTSENDEDLSDFAATLGFAHVGRAELDKQREEYRAFIAPFSGALVTTGGTA